MEYHIDYDHVYNEYLCDWVWGYYWGDFTINQRFYDRLRPMLLLLLLMREIFLLLLLLLTIMIILSEITTV